MLLRWPEPVLMPVKYNPHAILMLVVALALIACETKKLQGDDGQADESPLLPALQLNGQVLLYASEIDVTTCEALAPCDCCAGNYLFINDRQFIQIDYCEGDRRYRKGEYEFKNDRVILTFDRLIIDQFITRDEEGNFSPENQYVFEETEGDSSVITLTQLQCEKNLAFDTGDEMTPFATLVTTYEFSDLIRGMKEEGVWSRMKMK